MSSGSTSNPQHPAIEAAQLDFARDIHMALIAEASTLSSLGGSIESDQGQYACVLFARLAMHIASVEVPANASSADRARGTAEALRRIVQTPSLIERVTGTFQNGAISIVGEGVELGDALTPAEQLQEKVASAGYFDRSMIFLGESVRLDYVVPSDHKRRRLGIDKINPGQHISVKLAAEQDKAWQVQLYGAARRNVDTGQLSNFSQPKGMREIPLQNLFRVLAVESVDGALPRRLKEIAGAEVQLGQISTGAQLRLRYGFAHATSEVVGHSDGISSTSMHAPAHLQQAYFGTNTAYPLFPNSY